MEWFSFLKKWGVPSFGSVFRRLSFRLLEAGGGEGGCLDLVAARESQAMLNTVKDLLSSTGNAQVDAFVDNNVLLAC